MTGRGRAGSRELRLWQGCGQARGRQAPSASPHSLL